MAKIGAIDFANNVDYNRKKLIEHCGKNGIKVNENASLDIVVDANSNIMAEQNQDKIKVEFLDIDCSEFAPAQYIEKGGSATISTEIPSFDSEYLEFIEWATPCDVGFDNVQFDMVCMPRYKTKYDETLGQRPTYLICYFDETTLSPTINLSTATNTYIDWGDGTEAQQATTSNAHTYTNVGIYTIKIYGDVYKFNGSSSYGMFSTSDYRYSLIKVYLGENADFTRYSFTSRSLKNAVISKDLISSLLDGFNAAYALVSIVLPKITTMSDACFYQCHSLQYLIFSKGVPTSSSKQNFAMGCRSLKSLVLDYNIITTSTGTFQGCSSLKRVTLLKGINEISYRMFISCTSLEKINILGTPRIIGKETFSGCSLLKNIELPKELTTIGEKAFNGCNSLKSLTIPNAVTTLGDGNFNGSNLNQIIFESTLAGATIKIESMNVKEIVLPDNFDNTIICYSPLLSDETLIYILNKLKDNSLTGVIRTFQVHVSYQTKLNTIYLNEFDEVVPYGTEGAISLMQKFQNKNWTVSFTTPS